MQIRSPQIRIARPSVILPMSRNMAYWSLSMAGIACGTNRASTRLQSAVCLNLGCFVTSSCVGVQLHSSLRLTQEAHPELSETIGLVQRSESTGRQDDCQQRLLVMRSRSLRQARKICWVRGV